MQYRPWGYRHRTLLHTWMGTTDWNFGNIGLREHLIYCSTPCMWNFPNAKNVNFSLSNAFFYHQITVTYQSRLTTSCFFYTQSPYIKETFIVTYIITISPRLCSWCKINCYKNKDDIQINSSNLGILKKLWYIIQSCNHAWFNVIHFWITAFNRTQRVLNLMYICWFK